jgi:hypothetical protein
VCFLGLFCFEVCKCFFGYFCFFVYAIRVITIFLIRAFMEGSKKLGELPWRLGAC